MMEKYGIDWAAVQALLKSGECKTEEEAMEKVASGRAERHDNTTKKEEPHGKEGK